MRQTHALSHTALHLERKLTSFLAKPSCKKKQEHKTLSFLEGLSRERLSSRLPSDRYLLARQGNSQAQAVALSSDFRFVGR